MSHNENRSFGLPFLLALTLALALSLPGRGQPAPVEVYGPGGEAPVDFSSRSEPTNRLPVLFVHGHNPLDEGLFPSYQNNWVNRLCDLPSFDQALTRNPQLGVEPYYLRFRDQHRPIEDDAREIAHAVDLILQRHDPSYDPEDPGRRTHARVVLIAMSKGAISSRLYLKQLADYGASGCDGTRDLPCVASGFRPVSEFIALAPPNHGLRSAATDTVKGSDSLQQLNNGYGLRCSVELDEGHGFIDDLNGHPICDTFARRQCFISTCLCDTALTTPGAYPTEAPLSRAPDAKGRTGILYLTLFAEDGGDKIAGGDELSGDCQGRKLALNLAPDAVNVALAPESVSDCLADTHSLTSHWSETICRALYTAAYHRVPEADFSCPRDADKVPEVPAPPAANAVIALDLSGSMGSRPCPDCEPKVEYLRDAVELFVKLWGVVARPQDRIGAVYFRSQADLVQIGDDVLGPIGSHGQAILDDLNAADQQPSGSTAMGGALASAIGTLRDLTPDEGDTRHVVLFTDGMQNRNPMVQESADGGLVIRDDPLKTPPVTDYLPLDLADVGGTRVHTIGVGAGDASTVLLRKIAERTGGSFKASPGVGDLRRFFIEQVIDVMRGFSPQLVGYLWGSTGADGEKDETFEIEGVARKVIFMAHAEKGKPFELRVKKVGQDGQDVTALAKVVDGLFYRILSFDLPLEIDGTTIEAGGTWKLTIEDPAGGDLAYQALALVDGVELVHEAKVGGPMVAGRPLELTVRLSAAGQPVTGAAVSARVWSSGTALGTLLAKSPMPGDTGQVFEAAATGGQKKLQALLRQKVVSAQLKPLEPLGAQVDLLDQGDGTYRASYGKTAIPGTYKVVFRIRGSDDRVGGEYRRTETLSAQVEVGRLDPSRLHPRLRIADRDADSVTLKLILRPRDAGGHYLGPDYGDRIRIALGTAAPAPVVDRLDGSYEVTLTVPTNEDPRLELAVLGRQLFAESFSSFRRLARGSGWILSAHLGLTLPAGALDRLYDPGPLVELDLERAVSPRFALHGVIGRYQFDPGFDVDGATLYLRWYRQPPGAARLFAEIGPGVYDPEGTGTVAGLSAGFGVVRPLRPGLEGEIGAGYFHLFDSGDDIRFAALKVGLRFSF